MPTLIIDWNGIQIDGYNRDVMDVRDLVAKFQAFGWSAEEVEGNDMQAVDAALRRAIAVRGRPQVLCCRTVLGTPISFMTDKQDWHGVAPNAEQLTQALAELGAG